MMLLRLLHMMNWLKNLILLIQTNKILKKKIEDVDKKIPDNSKFIVTQYFNGLTKINVNARTTEVSKNLANKKSRREYT